MRPQLIVQLRNTDLCYQQRIEIARKATLVTGSGPENVRKAASGLRKGGSDLDELSTTQGTPFSACKKLTYAISMEHRSQTR